MDPWDHIRRACADTRSGSVDVAVRAAAGVSTLRTKRDIMRAARALVRAHPTMAPLWRLCADAFDDQGSAATYADRIIASSEASADSFRWVASGRRLVVLTHSSSGTVARALHRVRSRVALIICTASLPGGEGRSFARRLERDGFTTEVVSDAAISVAAMRADMAIIGADAITPESVVNKVGSRLVALAAADATIGCYAIAPSEKFLPFGVGAPGSEPTPLTLFDAIVTERGAQRPGAIKRHASRIEIPEQLARLAL